MVETLPPTVQLSLRRQRQRKEPVRGERGGLRFHEPHARLADHRLGVRIDLADRLQSLGRENDLVAAAVRRLAADEPGVSALRDDADARVVAEGCDAGHLLSRTRPDECERLAPVEAARLDERAGKSEASVNAWRAPTMASRAAAAASRSVAFT